MNRWRIYKHKGRWWVRKPAYFPQPFIAAGVYDTGEEAFKHFREGK